MGKWQVNYELVGIEWQAEVWHSEHGIMYRTSGAQFGDVAALCSAYIARNVGR